MSFDINKLLRKHIADLQPYSSARDEFDPVNRQVVYLDANENPFENGVNRYPDPQQRKLKLHSFPTRRSSDLRKSVV